MFSIFKSPCLVALFTSLVTSLPVDPSHAHTPSLVARQWEWNPQRALFCTYNPKDCREQFPELCWTLAEAPPFCSWSEPPLVERSVDSTALVSRQDDQPAREMFCRYNAKYCQEHFSGYCKGEAAPAWCHVEATPTELSPDDTNLASRQEGNPDRELFCKYNRQCCLDNFSKECRADSAPFWCPPEPPVDSTSLVPRQNSEPHRQMFCKYNAEYCQTAWPEYCNSPEHPAPEWCKGTMPPLDKRTPQDPDKEYPEKEDPEKEDPEKEEDPEEEDPEKEDEPEEEETPRPHTRSWCKKHPHHPSCYSQFCIDHPGSCKAMSIKVETLYGNGDIE